MRTGDMFPNIGVVPAFIVVAIIAIALQLSGIWVTMIIAGAFGALFTRGYLRSFIAGFAGVALAWVLLYVYLIITSQGMEIAEFFIGLLSLTGMGWLVFVIGTVLGALLGGFGAILGRATINLVDAYLDKKDSEKPAQ
jgi:hypothetical protein